MDVCGDYGGALTTVAHTQGGGYVILIYIMPRNKEGGESGESRQGNEQPRRPSYLDARRYPFAEEAGRAYFEGQEAMRNDSKANLSVYRVQIGPLLESHVVVLGDTPRRQLLERLDHAFASGKHVELTPDVLQHLMERRRHAEQAGPWVEGHYRPGNPVRLPRRRR